MGDVRIPDAIEPVIGWRAWDVTEVPDLVRELGHILPPAVRQRLAPVPSGPQLMSPHIEVAWPGGYLEWDMECRCGADVQPSDYELVQDAEQKLREYREVGRRLAVARRAGQLGEVARLEQRAQDLELWLPALQVRLEGRAAHHGHCVCGINAFATFGQMVDAGYSVLPRTVAIGEVELWGEVRSFERGWRGQYARARRVWALDDRFLPLVERAAQAGGFELAGSADEVRLMVARHRDEKMRRGDAAR
jgi:hypothetical protein